MTKVEEARKIEWTKDLKRVYARFPSSIRSQDWPEIVHAANAGDVAQAMALARQHEQRSKVHRAENRLARRQRIERVALFALQSRAKNQLGEIFRIAGRRVAEAVQDKGVDTTHLPVLNKTVHEAVVEMRRALNRWITDAIWQAMRLGLKHINAVVLPVLRESKALEEARELSEAPLTVGLTSAGGASLSAGKWKRLLDRIYADQVKKNSRGLTPSERIWETTQQAELAMKRILVNGIAQGQEARTLAKRLESYLSDETFDKELDTAVGETGAGVYKNPYKNALRMARTETSRAYTSAMAAWAKEKDWVEGLRATLSPAHEDEDICDDFAGELFTPDEFDEKYPLHPHCMCFGTIVIKPEFLADLVDDQDGAAAGVAA